MTGTVFVLCALTSLACAVLLLRGYFRTRARLLLWTGLCFTGLFVNNVLLIVDSRTPNVDLSVWRSLPAVAGLALLVYGLIWEADA
jgi:hypothetical protein